MVTQRNANQLIDWENTKSLCVFSGKAHLRGSCPSGALSGLSWMVMFWLSLYTLSPNSVSSGLPSSSCRRGKESGTPQTGKRYVWRYGKQTHVLHPWRVNLQPPSATANEERTRLGGIDAAGGKAADVSGIAVLARLELFLHIR